MRNILREIKFLRWLRNYIQLKYLGLNKVHYTSDVKISSFVHKSLVMGRYGYIGRGSSISAGVEIGNYVMISTLVSIIGKDHNYQQCGVPVIFSGRPEFLKTTIGNDVWLGHKCTILSGVNIGDGAIVAAGSVVTKSVRRCEIVGGVPAKTIGWRFTGEEIKKHCDLINSKIYDDQPPSNYE